MTATTTMMETQIAITSPMARAHDSRGSDSITVLSMAVNAVAPVAQACTPITASDDKLTSASKP
jgi:hypothetical protein